MPTFRFSLDSVLRLRNQTRDECRRQLGIAMTKLRHVEAQDQQVLDEQAELRNHLGQLSQGGRVDVGMVSRCHAYLAQLEKRHQEVLIARTDALLLAEARRKQLVEADQKVKALEKLREKQSAEFRQKQDTRERLEQEEIQSANRDRNLFL